MNVQRLSADDHVLYRKLRMQAVEQDCLMMVTMPQEVEAQSDEEMRGELAKSYTIAAFIGLEAVAMGGLFRHGDLCRKHVAVIQWVFVSHQFRGKGISKALMENIEAYARKEGIEAIELNVVADNQPAIGLYRSLGYVEYGKYPRAVKIDGMYYDGAYMVKFLSA